jgi:hypothetical protein
MQNGLVEWLTWKRMCLTRASPWGQTLLPETKSNWILQFVHHFWPVCGFCFLIIIGFCLEMEFYIMIFTFWILFGFGCFDLNISTSLISKFFHTMDNLKYLMGNFIYIWTWIKTSVWVINLISCDPVSYLASDYCLLTPSCSFPIFFCLLLSLAWMSLPSPVSHWIWKKDLSTSRGLSSITSVPNFSMSLLEEEC